MTLRRGYIILWSCFAFACQSSKKADEKKISPEVFGAREIYQKRNDERYYASDVLPTASCCGLQVLLLLKNNGYAELIEDYNNSTGGPERRSYGMWRIVLPEGNIEANFVGEGNYGFPLQQEHSYGLTQTYEFVQKGDSLVEVPRADRGSSLVLRRRRTWPLPAEREMFLWVDKQKALSKNPFFLGEGLRVSFRKHPPQNYAEWDWDGILDKIQGFDYKPGKIYRLQVKRKPIKDFLGQRERCAYELLKIDSTLDQ